jgi:signal transduction histidine kinase/DNA-binding response OmpR family regulator/ligand-binding sensor domain-containing protein
MMTFRCVIVIILTSNISLYAGDIVIRRISVADLPSNTVYRMFHDSKGYIWLGTQNGFCRYDGYGMKSFRSEIANPSFPSNNITGDFAEDPLNNTIWIATEKGILILDQHTCSLSRPDSVSPEEESPVRQILYDNESFWVCSDLGLYLYNPDGSLRKKYLDGANSIHRDKNGTLRVTVWHGGIYYLDKNSDSFVQYPQRIGDENNPHKIFQDKNGQFWVCTWGDGLYRFYPDLPSGKLFEQVLIRDNKDLDFGIFFDVEQDDLNGYLWLLSYAGLTVLDIENGSIRTLDQPAATINEHTNLFADIMKDRNGNIWIGTYEQGLMVIDPAPSPLTNFNLQAIKTETGYIPNISRLFEDNDRQLWMRSERLGLYILDPKSSKTRKPEIPESGYATAISNCSKNNEIWVATEYVPNILRLRKSKTGIDIIGSIDMHAVTGDAQTIKRLHEDSKGGIWAASTASVHLWTKNRWKTIAQNCGAINGIAEDLDGNIWIASSENGLWKIEAYDTSFNINNYSQSNSGLPANHISCLSAGTKDKLWICINEYQLYEYQISKHKFIDHTSKANIENHVIMNIVAGDNGHVWLSSNRQIIEYNPSNEASIQFDAIRDMTPNSVNRNAAIKLRDGSVAFGGNQGCCIISPSDRLDRHCKKTHTEITDIRINGKSIYQDPKKIQNLTRQDELTLRHNETNLEIVFSSFNYLDPGKTRFAYKLEGVDSDWNYSPPNRNFAVYNQLRKGAYVFTVKATGDNQLWSDEICKLTIVKKPAAYETPWAYAGYFLAVLFLVGAALRIYVSRIYLRNELQIVQLNKRKSEELIQTKLRFFTNIGHEFRTPLTLIITPLTAIIGSLTDNDRLKQKLASIHRNAEDLLRLINQLLDFRKLEMSGEKLKLACDDFVKFAQYVHLAFKDLALNKTIDFTFDSSVNQIFMAFDKSKLRKIINNLYSNALKFTPSGGYIATYIRLVIDSDREYVRIDVEDAGCGIHETEYQAIFQRFYQSIHNDQDTLGSGVGLHLAKEYVELHGGKINLSSKVGEGSIFSVYIPTDLKLPDEAEPEEITEHPLKKAETEAPEKPSSLRTLLIVEDNAELRHFLSEQFEGKFRIMQAAEGKEALAIIAKQMPDLIVSDLMMPVLNGVDLCQQLKNNVHTSHIPIILLTAKLSDETKIEAYRAGADSYIPKPFNFDVLMARIETLIEQQERRKKLFHKTIEISPSAVVTSSLDEELIKKALCAVETNIDNSEYSVDDLAAALAFSRRQLSRKFQSIIGLSPAEFIRSVRLKRAAQLLRDSQYNISEIAYMVGFNTIKYFNLNFKEEFGLTPSEYRRQK